MISDKDLFSIMLKYHPAIVGRLISKGRVVKKENCITLLEVDEESDSDSINYSPFRELETDENNVTKVVASSSDMERREIYLEVKTSYPKIFKDLKGFVYNSNFESTYRYFCHPSAIHDLLVYHSDDICSLKIPKGERITKNLIPYYIRILQKQVSIIKERKEKETHFSEDSFFMYSYKNYYGDRYGDNGEWYEYVKKCGIMAYTPIYYEIEWDFDLVEKYKDKILWLNLMEDSNLQWSEEKMLEYEQYIPHKQLRSSKVYANNIVPAAGYGKVGMLSNNYIESHKEIINWEVFVETASFIWDSDDLKHFYEYVNREENVFAMYELSKNSRFTWTPDLLKTMIELYSGTLDYCITEKRFSDLLFQIPNYRALVGEKNDDPDFWYKLKDGGKRPNGAYSDFFTIENIEANHKHWEEVQEEKFLHVHRTPDTNYHYYVVFTMWDYFVNNQAILLTYDLCKYLSKIEIKRGGTYCLADGISMEEDHRFPVYNGLEAFGFHNFANEEEIEKICADSGILDWLLKYLRIPNKHLVDYLIDRFFENYKIEDYLEIVNQMKDWNRVREYIAD